ncbi:hypothetical protein HUU62_09040 [Rhodoferax sp. 4810]|uniref:Uncharacterized protein n=1 Tax=Thiospirillum jenense TaxID=1653858 RepID=A0A839HHU2_9GAMM|nr:hypothetical protein [Thiospirillum jenense]MBB1074554.1 hypothetical protein [Rhodoferax jenense]MBB1126527.1 hypothetical protein [Thiospirillum jenense]
MDQLFDVVFFGVQDDKDPIATAHTLATSFGIPIETATALVQKPAGTVIKKAVTLEVAQRYQVVMTQAGAKVNYKPCTTGTKLELVAIEKARFTCPNCQHQLESDEGETRPDICPQCGIVFTKLQKTDQAQQEIEEIKIRLQKIKEMQDAEDQRKQQEIETEERRSLLEKRLRKEMGLPTALNTPTRLWSAATLTLLFGIAGGFLSAKLFFTEGKLAADGSITAPPAAGAMTMETLAMAIQSGAAGTNTVEQLAVLSQAVMTQAVATDANTTATVDGAPAVLNGASDGANLVNNSADPASAVNDNDSARLDLLRQFGQHDPEWDALLQTHIASLMAANQVTRAEKLLSYMRDPYQLAQAQTQLIIGYTRADQVSQANMMLRKLLENSQKLATGARRIELVTSTIPLLVKAGLKVPAQQLLEQAEQWNEAIIPSGERAFGWARVAWAQAHLSLNDAASGSISQALAALDDPMSVELRMQATGQLAAVFYHLSALREAHAILNQAHTSLVDIPQASVRDLAIQQLAQAWVQIDQLERGLRVSAELSNVAQRDAFLLKTLHTRAFTNNGFGLSSLAEAISAAGDRARGYALLGRTADNAAVAADQFQRAVALASGLAAPFEQAVVLGDIARLQSRSDRQAAAGIFAHAEEQLRLLPAGVEADIGWGRLAENRIRALEPALAQTYVQQIKAMAVQAVARQDVQYISQVLPVL